MASYYRRKNGTYSIRVSNGKLYGKQQFINTTYKPPKEFDKRKADRAAGEFAELFEQTVRSGMYVPEKKRKSGDVDKLGLTLSQFVEEYYYQKVE